MEKLTLDQVADLLEFATLEQTFTLGHAIVHHGITTAGSKFTLMNDHLGQSVVSYGS